MDPSQLNVRSRYDFLPPPPPAPNFADPSYYPEHQHRHRHRHPPPPFHSPPPHPPPPPHPHPHLHRHQYPDLHPPTDPRLFLPYPGPAAIDASFNPHPRPIVRVSDGHFPHPEPRPSPFPRRSRHPSPPREFWDGRGDYQSNLEVSDRRPYPARPDWEPEAWHRGLFYPPADPVSPIIPKKRFRFEQDRDFEENHPSRREQRRIEEICDDQVGHSDVNLQHNHNHVLVQTMLEAPFSSAALSPRGPPSVQVPDRIRGREASPTFEWQRPLPSVHSRGQSHLDTEAFERSPAQEDHDYQENSFSGNRRKRSLSGGYTESRVPGPVQQKPRVLSRMHGGKSVWERIEERPAFLPSSSPPWPCPPHPAISSLEEHHELDMSYKSNGLVANVFIPTSLGAIALSSSENGPAVKATPMKKVKKANRSRVVVRIATDEKAPQVRETTSQASLPDNFDHVLGAVKSSPDTIISSSKCANDASSTQSSLKRIGKTTVLAKSPAKKLAKAFGSGEGSATKVIKRKGKSKIVEEEAEKHLNVITTEATVSNHSTSQACHQDSILVTSVRDREGGDAGDGEEQCKQHCDMASENSADPLVFAQEFIKDMKSPRKNAAKESPEPFVLVDNRFVEDTIKQAQPTKEDIINPTSSDIESSKSSIEKYSEAELGNDAQVVLSVGSSAFSYGGNGNSPQGKSVKRKRGRKEDREQSDVGMVSKDNLCEKSELSDPCLHSNVNYSLSVLPPEERDVDVDCGLSVIPSEVRDIDLNRTLTNEILRDGEYDIRLSVRNCHTESDCMSSRQDVFDIPFGDSMGETMDQFLTSKQSKLDSLIVNSKVQDTDCIIDGEQSYCQFGRKEFSSDHSNQNKEETPVDKDEPLLSSEILSVSKGEEGVPLGRAMGERMDQLLTSKQSKLDSLIVKSKVQDTDCLIDGEQSYCHLDHKEYSGDHSNENKEETPLDKERPSLSPEILSVSKGEEGVPSGKAMTLYCPIFGTVQPLSLDQPKSQVAADRKLSGEESTSQKANLSTGIPIVAANQMRLSGSTKGPARSNHSARHKTWHRNSASPTSTSHGKPERPGGSYMHKQSPRRLTRLQTSYIRKGNSLIRKSATEVHPPTQTHNLSTSNGGHTTRRSTDVDITVDRTDHLSHSNLPVERPKTPPLPLAAKLQSCIINPQRAFTNPMSEILTSEPDKETQFGQLEGQTVLLPSGSLGNQSTGTCRISETDKTKRMVYVKHKSNQLVAAPRPEPSDSFMIPNGMSQSLSSSMLPDLYYRLKKNQLIRNGSSGFQQKQDNLIVVDKSTTDDHCTFMDSSLKFSTTSLLKKTVGKAIQKSYKRPKSSLVWTLSGEKPRKKGLKSLDHWKVLPHLFPWKRTIYYKNSASVSDKYSLPLISRKLQLMRKRNTTYKLSNDGFSLRKTGVFSIGGSSLKWSKSIERRSKKASEEATRAVAEEERTRRERKKSNGAKEKPGTFLPRERIFRVGSARYKMDSSRRTLIRIPDEQSSSTVDQQSGNKSQKSFVPRRLLIGNDEYIRIGNGNQLVRDPRKRIRILASEKVRWSLHTARLRLLRKQQYCQFFTRFGKCNKSGGKCPYIHDATKVAICTKYLRGLCSDANCKLTHKVLPERMPDCSYFLQGLCTNLNCSYRHVKVNPRASVCEGFLRGYCADGDECRKKHSYVCPAYEAMGKCQQGSKCKLHHPKKRNKSKRRKNPIIQNNSSGRYFGSIVIDVEHLIVSSDQHNMEDAAECFHQDGRFTDFVGLDAGTEGGGIEMNPQVDSQSSLWDSGHSNMQADDLDVLIKPLRIMKRANTTNAFANS